ncbi:MAG: hypothetical protein HN368_19070 [Spirochaetales bacterium]|nr:hypothetical protein [Spirochaetales bacterium]
MAVEADRGSGLLIKDSMEIIDDRVDGINEELTLSNFFVREERESGDILLYLPRLFAQNIKKPGGEGDFTCDLLEYRFSL